MNRRTDWRAVAVWASLAAMMVCVGAFAIVPKGHQLAVTWAYRGIAACVALGIASYFYRER